MSQADMQPNVRENLSAGIDDELSREELRFLLRRLDHDGELRRTWLRYHVVRDGLRQQLPLMAEAGFAARVMLAIEQEAAPASARRQHWLRWSAGGAIAASVAAAALMIAQPTGDAERGATLTARTTSSVSAPSLAARNTASLAQPAVPAAVPTWLSGKAPGLLSQQASATLGAPIGAELSPYERNMAPFRMQRYRTLDKHDGSYLILLDPEQPVLDYPRQASAGAQ